jgi:hypothetical protein
LIPKSSGIDLENKAVFEKIAVVITIRVLGVNFPSAQEPPAISLSPNYKPINNNE